MHQSPNLAVLARKVAERCIPLIKNGSSRQAGAYLRQDHSCQCCNTPFKVSAPTSAGLIALLLLSMGLNSELPLAVGSTLELHWTSARVPVQWTSSTLVQTAGAELFGMLGSTGSESHSKCCTTLPLPLTDDPAGKH